LVAAIAVLGTAAVHAVSIYDIQYSTTGPSPFADQVVTIEGTVTAIYYGYYAVADDAGPWNALMVYDSTHGPDIGDYIRVTGTVQEYYDMTELVNVTAYELLATGQTPPEPPVIATGEVANEQWESVVVRIAGVTVQSLLDYAEWTVNDGSGAATINDLGDYVYFPAVGDQIDSITGMVFYSFSVFKIEPRNTRDIVWSGAPHFAVGGMIVTMNDAQEVIEHGYVEVHYDQVVGVTSTPPAGIQVVETGGLIFPGLIDCHNHPTYNFLDFIPLPGIPYEERYDWQDEPIYDDFKDQYNFVMDYPAADDQEYNIMKLSECREMIAGTTTIQGRNCNYPAAVHAPYAHEGIGIANGERFPNLVYDSVFPIGDDWESVTRRHYNRFIIHLSEGTNAHALNEFNTWRNYGLLDYRSSLIHCVPFGETEFRAMAEAEATLIWAPRSNWELYRTTANVPLALELGVNVALGPDWTESSSLDLLEELRFAWSYNVHEWGSVITPYEMVKMVTTSAAYAFGDRTNMGKICPGARADLMVIPHLRDDPYEALLYASAADVALTVTLGIPRYGDPALMDQFTWVPNVEPIDVCGVENKRLALAVNAHGYAESGKTMAEILAEIEEAYFAGSQAPCAFLPLDPCAAVRPTATPTPVISGTPATRTPSPTPTPTSPTTNTPTATPTATPTESGTTSTPTPTPTMAATDTPGPDMLTVNLTLSQEFFTPGDQFLLTFCYQNPGSGQSLDQYVLLDVFGLYFFWPGWEEAVDFERTFVRPGSNCADPQTILEFTWPDTDAAADGVAFWGAYLNPSAPVIVGNFDHLTFGFGPTR